MTQPLIKKNCAIYTRKSNEEGLEMEYNSLDAQYDAAMHYIHAQQSQGWVLVNKRYDDGGNIKLITENQRSITNDDGTITVHIPISFKRHGGRKYIIAPDAIPSEYQSPANKESLLKALGRAFEWKEMLASDPTLNHDIIADKVGLPRSYVSRVMKVTLLAPDIIDLILDGKQPKHMNLADVSKMPSDWNEQREYFGIV